MALKWKIQQQPILNLKMVPQVYFLQRIPTSGIPVSNFKLYLEKGKLTIKDSILTRLNEEGKKERDD